MNHKDHQQIHDVIANEITAPWILTYDDVKEIEELYSDYYICRFDITYSAANKGTASEFADLILMVTSLISMILYERSLILKQRSIPL